MPIREAPLSQQPSRAVSSWSSPYRTSPLCSTGLHMHLDSETSFFESPTKSLWCLSKVGCLKHSWFDPNNIPSLDPVPCKQMLCRKWNHFLKRALLCLRVLLLGSLGALSLHWKDLLIQMLAWTVSELVHPWRLLWTNLPSRLFKCF